MVGESVKSNVRSRVDNTKGTLKGIVSDFREIGVDIKNRVIDGAEPTFAKRVCPGLVGRTGSLPADVIAIPLAIIDRIEAHVHGFAKINRRWVKR